MGETVYTPRSGRNGHDLERLAGLVMEHGATGLALVSPAGRFLAVNRAFAKLAGRPSPDLVGRWFHEVSHPADAVHHADLLSRAIDGDLPGYRLEARVRRPDGSVVWGDVAVSIIREPGEPVGILVEIVDVTSRTQREDELREQAMTDPLTGLANRASVEHQIEDAQRLAAATGTSFAVLMIDLDDFKPVNDRYGHAVGDAVLRATAGRLAAALRPGDLIARFGGDEFVVVAAGLPSRAAADDVTRRLLRSIRRPLSAGGHRIRVDASIGVHVAEWDEPAPEAIAAADAAMYDEKRRRALERETLVDLTHGAPSVGTQR